MASTLIVFSHLRWDAPCRRTQHLLTRLARQFRVVFVEEPVHHPGPCFLETFSPAPDVLACRPHTPARAPGFHDDHLPHLRTLMRGIADEHPQHVAWFCTPMALPLLDELDARLVVADCMEDLSAFSDTPRQWRQRELALLDAADLVLAGGPSLFRAHRALHTNVHCLPASVDVRHFAPALDRANSHPLHRDIPGPRLGYYGVIDSCIDLGLLRDVADAHPRWQIVLVGPAVGIDPATLPRRPNLHYLGEQPYEALPRFLAGWDVCLLPLAPNAAARCLNPPQILEYMAAELPIVSTPVPDVIECCGEAVAIAHDAASFVAACERALLAAPQERAQQVAKMRALLAGASWDACAAQVATLLRTAQRRQPDASLPTVLPPPLRPAGASMVA